MMIPFLTRDLGHGLPFGHALPTGRACHSLPRLAVAMGDPAGIAPELTAKLLQDAEITTKAALLIIGDARILAQGAAVSGVSLDIDIITHEQDLPGEWTKPCLLDLGHLAPEAVPLGRISRAGGEFSLRNFSTAIALAANGHVDAVMFTPFNKAAMRLAQADYEDETAFVLKSIAFSGMASEFNILPQVWNARVTSHVAVKDVAPRITQESILQNLRLTDRAMRDAGFACPRIAVAGLNPHAGDDGTFGREEIDIIAPAIRIAQQEGIGCDGPYPPDTVFLRALRGDCDGVLTMYHDQGQIAMKLIGFDDGVTLLGGFPFPLLTPAHGSAYDIAGKGVASITATRNAALLATRMGQSARLARRCSDAPGFIPRIAAE
jgi:4-hydroxythreonine-4-phosphate dehydrogenase